MIIELKTKYFFNSENVIVINIILCKIILLFKFFNNFIFNRYMIYSKFNIYIYNSHPHFFIINIFYFYINF